MLLFVPTTYKIYKIVLLGCSLLLVLISSFNKRKLYLTKDILNITFLMSFTGLCFVYYGEVMGNPGALPVITVYVAWPILYVLLISLITKEDHLKQIIAVFNFALLCILIYCLSYILTSKSLLPKIFYVELNLGQNIGFYEGHTEITMYSLASLMFLVPFFLSYFYLNFNEMKKLNQTFSIITILLIGIITLLSGRRALQVIVLLTPILHFLLYVIIYRGIGRVGKLFKYIALGIPLLLFLLIIANSIYGINITSIINIIKDGFDFSNPYDPRKQQFFSLIRDWGIQPLFGAGLGATTDVVRSIEMPWAYELSYVALLFNVGIIGFIIYTGGVIWIYCNLVNIAQSSKKSRYLIIPLLVGMSSFLIANATNPYLGKFDFLWVIFIPIGFINFYRLNNLNHKLLGQ